MAQREEGPATKHRLAEPYAGGAYVPTAFCRDVCARGRYDGQVSKLKHQYGLNHLHYLTNSTYRRARLFDSERFKKQWVATFDELRRELKFRILGYVLMPEHFHSLIWPAAEANPSQIMQKLEDRTALFILKGLCENLGYAWRPKMLARVTLPPPFTIMRTFGCGNGSSTT